MSKNEQPPKENTFDMNTAKGRADYISHIFANLASGVGEATAVKMKNYADRIHAGEPKEKVLDGVGASFTQGVENLLKGYPEKNTPATSNTSMENQQLEVGTPVLYKDPKHSIPTKHFIADIDTMQSGDRKGEVVYHLKNEIGTPIQQGGVKMYVNKDSFQIVKTENEVHDSEKTTSTEDIQALKDLEKEMTKADAEGDTRISSLEAQIQALENEGTTPATPSTPNATPKSPEPVLSDEEKLRQIRTEILAKKVKFFNEATAEQNQKIDDSRKIYVNKYGEWVKESNGLNKAWDKTLNWLGLGKKDAYAESIWTVKRDKQTYNEEKNTKGGKTAEIYAEKRIQDKLADYEKEGWTPGQIQKMERIYKARLKKENAFSNNDLNFVEQENQKLRAEKEAVWEANKSDLEKRMQKTQEWVKRNLDKNPGLKKAIGNKWARIGVTSLGIGLATGGIGSVAFWGSRVARVAGGTFGSGTGKLIGDKWIKTEERIAKKEAELKEEYKNGSLTASDYDKRMDDIALSKIRLERAKNALTIGLGGIGGYTAGFTEAHFMHPTGTGSMTTGGKETQPEIRFNEANKKAVDDLLKNAVEREGIATPTTHDTTSFGHTQPESIIDSTDPQANGGTSQTFVPETIVETTPASTEINPDWLVHKGEGIENPLIRQIKSSTEIQNILGYKPGMNLDNFAGKAAHQLYESNYGHGSTQEIRITGAGADKVHIELRINNGGLELHDNLQGHELQYEYRYDSPKHVDHQVHTKEHIEHLRKEIDNTYPQKEPIDMEKLTPVKAGPTVRPIHEAPYRITPEPINGTPNNEVTPKYVPRLPHLHNGPRTYGDPMYNTPGHLAEPDAGRNQYLESQRLGKVTGNTTEQNLAQNNAPQGKDFFTVLMEAFFGKDTPDVPHLTATPGTGFEDISKAA